MTNAWTDLLKYFRIIPLSFFVYDWLCTMPCEYRLYKKQPGITRMSTACILLILTRYLGLIALCFNFYAFFSHDFTWNSCAIFYRFLPITQCLASWASRAIFVVRTSAICNRDFKATVFLTGLAVVCSGLEIFAQLYSFRKYKAGTSGNCLIQYSEAINISWVYYLAASVFDIVVIFMTYRGLSIHYDARNDNKSGFSSVLWNSSLLYFVVTTVFNLVNLVFYAVFGNSNATIFCAMGIAFTSMMSARVILNLHDYADRPLTVQFSGFKSSHRSRPLSNQSKSSTLPSPISPSGYMTSFPAIAEEEPHDYDLPSLPRKSYSPAPWETQFRDHQRDRYGDTSCV